MIADADTMKSINRAISSAKDSVMKLIKQAHDKKLETEPGRTMMESFENKVNEVIVCVFDYGLPFILYIGLPIKQENYHYQLSCLTSSPLSFYSRFSTRLVIWLEAVRRRACLTATISRLLSLQAQKALSLTFHKNSCL